MGSDHCILILTINLPKEIRIEERQEKSNIQRIKWNEKNKTMSLPCTLKKIKEIEELLDDESQVDVNGLLKQINEVYTISNKLLTRKETINKKNQKKIVRNGTTALVMN